jgi:hypothetical protein
MLVGWNARVVPQSYSAYYDGSAECCLLPAAALHRICPDMFLRDVDVLSPLKKLQGTTLPVLIDTPPPLHIFSLPAGSFFSPEFREHALNHPFTRD